MVIALVDKNIKELIRKKIISSEINLNKYVQPASLDIPIGDTAYLVKRKFLPFMRNVDYIVKRFTLKKINLKDKENILFKGQTYLIPCLNINLPKNYFIKVSPKSSIGRIDVLVRTIFDKSGLYDYVSSGSKGRLWIEVTPQSFNIRLKPGLSLTQLMVFEDVENSLNIENKKLIYNSNKFLNSKNNIYKDNKLILSLNVKGSLFGYEAKHTNEIIDLSKKNHDWRKFFRIISIPKDQKSYKYTLIKDKFYILSTKEKISVPLGLSAEMIPFSHLVGELRAHYAGFFDPGWGFGKNGEIKGANGTLEVRPHEDVTIYDSQPICLIEFFKNKEQPINYYGSVGNNYQGQNKPKLAKFFK